MPTRRIEKDDWKSYLDEFSKSHGGLTVSIHTADPSGQRSLVRAEPFVGISFEEKGSGAGSVIVMVGATRDDHEEHAVLQPKDIYHKDAVTPYSDETNTDIEELEITSHGMPPITLLTFDRRDDARLELNPNG